MQFGRTKACHIKMYDNAMTYANAMHEYDKR